MEARRWFLTLGILCGCDSLASPAGDAGVGPGDHAAPEPLSPDLLAACPESERFERAGANECTAIGCQSGYSLNVSPSSGWQPGAYRFELTVDGRAVKCTGALPLKACAERSFSCDADGVRLGESGCALEASQQGIAGIAFDGFPLALSMRVLRDGVEVVSAELTPVYRAGQPNGPGCDPICCSASDELRVTVNR
jgi:hypothetical protein